MDLKISNQIPADSSSAPAARTDVVTSELGLGGRHRLQSAGSIGADRIEISSLTERISDGMNTESAQRSDRVRHLAALYSSGRYSPAPSDVSRALVSHALAGKTTEGL